MQLPGGIRKRNGLRRSFCFHPVNGDVELALYECAREDAPLARRVTRAIARALSELAGDTPDVEQVRDLSVGDRQFLMRQLSVHLGLDAVWLSATCKSCGELFDTRVEQSKLPVKAAAKGFPNARIPLAGGRVRLRVPTGADQEALSGIENDEQAVQALAAGLVHGAISCELDGAAIASIEAAVEAVAPEVTLEVEIRCPHCEAPNRVYVDPYLCLEHCAGSLFRDIHTLAAGYHWSEAEILALPRARRQIYLRLLDRERGMSDGGAYR